jgi:hypothetical protein
MNFYLCKITDLVEEWCLLGCYAGVTSQKTPFFIVTAVKASNLTLILLIILKNSSLIVNCKGFCLWCVTLKNTRGLWTLDPVIPFNCSHPMEGIGFAFQSFDIMHVY